MGILTEKSHFCALSVMFLRLVCILKLEGLLQGYVKWKNTMTGNVNFLSQNVVSETSLLRWKVSFKAVLSGKTQWGVMSTFWHKMSNLKPVCSIKMWKLTEKSHFCALSVMFLRLVSILTLEGLLQGYVKWKNTMTGNVNFLTQNVKSETSLLN